MTWREKKKSRFPLPSKLVFYVKLWGASSGSESIEWRDWQTEGPTSGWGSSWERSSFGSWFSTFVFRNVPGTVPECVHICGFKRKSSNLDRAPKQNAGLCPAELLGQFFSDLAFHLLRKLCEIFLVNSRNGRLSWLAVPRTSFFCFSCNGCQLSFVSQCCHLFEGKMLRSYEGWISFHLLLSLRSYQKLWFFGKNN